MASFQEFILGKNIVLDEEEFTKASEDFKELAGKIDSLYKDITDMLTDIKTGFDSPAGKKFVNSCENALLEPLERQKTVVTHIADNLTSARNSYRSVFEEYREAAKSMSPE
ncbi:hypothetical protein SAMN02910447_02291 [Ruminococcus sp. YE71]|uniref:hypothetical protein n=1 Tax=unclassified Ruminococcus TaxID=2608920 RepID=UPI0008803811|nr:MULTISPECIES: hypothetical protein [unclassified Ruminococcus]SDA23144.1 hypothetical protein SAMN02910446_02158 [Ruminococcus sp. YE78]SFW39343.1 hypothetical protein SAMN02910447_02291 [Ruminococcus sp. YE71]